MAFDTNQLLYNAALTSTQNGTGLRVRSTRLAGVWVRFSVPQATGTTPTLDITVQDSADNSTFNTVTTLRQITASGSYRQRIFTDREYVRAVMTVGGTTPNFGTVVGGFESGGQYKDAQSQ